MGRAPGGRFWWWGGSEAVGLGWSWRSLSRHVIDMHCYVTWAFARTHLGSTLCFYHTRMWIALH